MLENGASFHLTMSTHGNRLPPLRQEKRGAQRLQHGGAGMSTQSDLDVCTLRVEAKFHLNVSLKGGASHPTRLCAREEGSHIHPYDTLLGGMGTPRKHGHTHTHTHTHIEDTQTSRDTQTLSLVFTSKAQTHTLLPSSCTMHVRTHQHRHQHNTYTLPCARIPLLTQSEDGAKVFHAFEYNMGAPQAGIHG